MRRLVLSAILTLGLLVAAGAGTPQAPAIPRVGFLAASAPSPLVEAFRLGLRDLGYVEDRNVVIHARWADGRGDRLPDLAAELVSLNADVIVTLATRASLAAKNVAGTTPIVMVCAADPVGAGLVDSLARPGRNKILKGAAPADLPVEPPTAFEFIVNRRTAKTLNLKIPEPVLLRADEIVE